MRAAISCAAMDKAVNQKAVCANHAPLDEARLVDVDPSPSALFPARNVLLSITRHGGRMTKEQLSPGTTIHRIVAAVLRDPLTYEEYGANEELLKKARGLAARRG